MNTPTPIKLRMEYDEKWHSFILNNRIAFYKFIHDEDAGCPVDILNEDGSVDERADCDGNGGIIIFRRGMDFDRIKEFMEENPDVVKLEKYEHSGEHWSIASEGNYPDRQWDVTGFAGLWVPDKNVYDNAFYHGQLQGDERKTKLREYCRGVLESWNNYVSGNFYGRELQVYRLIMDEDGEPVEDLHEYEQEFGEPLNGDDTSLWGMEDEYAAEETAQTLEYWMNGRKVDHYEGQGESHKPVYKYELEPMEPLRRLNEEGREALIEKRVDAELEPLTNGSAEERQAAIEKVRGLLRKHFDDMTDHELQEGGE